MKTDGKTKRHHDLALSGYGESMRESASQKKDLQGLDGEGMLGDTT